MIDHGPVAVSVRPFAADDLARFRDLAADPRVTRYVGDGSPWDAARATARAGAAELPGHRWHSIVLDDVTWAGIVILEPVDDADAENDADRELGIWVHAAHWGTGVATRAVAAVIERHLADQPHARLIAHVAPANAGSRKLMARLGFHQGPRVRSRYGTEVDEFRLLPRA